MIIAIDGPAGSGKSTTARAVARRLGFFYLDTGAMYRAVALVFMRQGLDPVPENAEAVLAGLDMEMKPGADGLLVFVGGAEVTAAIREPAVSSMASRVSQIEAVRERMVEEQRRLAAKEGTAGRGVVLEGRDIGTVVFPNADLKIFLTADLDVRAARRTAQMSSAKKKADARSIRTEMAARDESDSTREASPLVRAPDAVEIDTTRLTFKDQVARIVALAGERRRSRHVRS